ncbi:ribonuclease H-like domain-containing protein [Tanacetum coccineum]
MPYPQAHLASTTLPTSPYGPSSNTLGQPSNTLGHLFYYGPTGTMSFNNSVAHAPIATPQVPQQGGIIVPGNYTLPSSVIPQATMLPHAFQTMTLQEPVWNMVIGASSHLADKPGMLTSFSNSSIYKSVFVGNGQSIPMIIKPAGSFSIVTVPAISTMSLNNHPPPSLSLLLSPTTWHQRLEHPGKHTKLPSYSSESNVASVFDIIHSDLWTSLISTLINSSTTNMHLMVKRAKAGISKPLARMNCHVTTTSPLSRSYLLALKDPNWNKAMVDEYNALISNGTWALVSCPTNVNVVHSMWIFRHKFNADGSLSRYKARLVADGHSQQ